MMMRWIEVILKNGLPKAYRQAALTWYRCQALKGTAIVCPCCQGSFSQLLPFGVHNRRENAQCPQCRCLERHRNLWLYLQTQHHLVDTPIKLLHVAPESIFEAYFKGLPHIDYLTMDLYNPKAMVQMDVTAMSFDDNTFDAVICNHVLEHVGDDRQAMREILRVLKPGGWAILQSPIGKNQALTLDDPTITCPEERTRLYGQPDHVRLYGQDYGNILRSQGFEVTIDTFLRDLPDATVEGNALHVEDIYLCHKPSAETSRGPAEQALLGSI